MKHKHYDMIVAWANGAQIEVEEPDGSWVHIPIPSWYEHNRYRVRPELKPDFYTYLTITHSHTGTQTLRRCGSHNVKFTYDGETHKLKSVEII
jgi:hypothetical protein